MDTSTGLYLAKGPNSKVLSNSRVEPDSQMGSMGPKLQAVNGTKISTYGEKLIKIRPKNSKTAYLHRVLLADLDDAILGFNFLIDFKLDLAWRGNVLI